MVGRWVTMSVLADDDYLLDWRLVSEWSEMMQNFVFLFAW